VIARGIERPDLRPDADVGVATELLVGLVYFRLMFGGTLSPEFAEGVVDSVIRGFVARPDEQTAGHPASTGISALPPPWSTG